MTEQRMYRFSASDGAPGMPTIIDEVTGRSILASLNGTPVFANLEIAKRVLTMLNDQRGLD